MPKEHNPQIRLVQNAVDLWSLPLVAAGCATCGQAHLIPEKSLGAICPGCGKSRMELQPAQLRPEPPELV
ncbi:MAG: hypothetical protein K8R77_05285, partial [Anaerolineaceae bacterium]|nr:hypothetical protein [Anaerolineaceae bacterium]